MLAEFEIFRPFGVAAQIRQRHLDLDAEERSIRSERGDVQARPVREGEFQDRAIALLDQQQAAAERHVLSRCGGNDRHGAIGTLWERKFNRRSKPGDRRADRQALRYYFNDPATTEIYTLSLHAALPI